MSGFPITPDVLDQAAEAAHIRETERSTAIRKAMNAVTVLEATLEEGVVFTQEHDVRELLEALLPAAAAVQSWLDLLTRSSGVEPT